MPVRIYDIAKRLGIENKIVLAKAKELGMTSARVPSSSLDKISAEYLEDQLKGLKPPEPKETPAAEPIVILKSPAEEPVAGPQFTPQEQQRAPTGEVPPATVVEVVPPFSPGEIKVPAAPVVEAPAGPSVEPAESVKTIPILEVAPEPAPPLEEAKPETPPPEPPAPKVGDKVGFIQLPVRPVPRGGKTAGRVGGVPGRLDPTKEISGGRPVLKNRLQSAARPVQPVVAKPPTRAEPRPAPPVPQTLPPEGAETITLKPPIIVRDLADKLNRKPWQLIADLIELKVMASVNNAIDEDTARRLCAKYGFRFEVEKRERGGGTVHSHIKKVQLDQEDKEGDLVPRAPVVTIMGHVDHGKTTLLDVIRKTNVAAEEAGGITQHIGAYTISVPHPDRKDELQQITFLDTPGHAAFTSMRARGANVTDIVVLVVAANDGVMPQTVEAISHAKEAGVPILVAVNKCDHPSASPMKVRQQLQDKGLVPDEWGGDTIFVDVSALTKQGVDKLLEMILLQAELLELKANPKRRAKGNVIESGLEPGGPTASVLVRSGTLRRGDTMICGPYWGRVRALINDEDERPKEAGPSVAVRVLGLNGIPEAGLEFNVVQDEKTAKQILEEASGGVRGPRPPTAPGLVKKPDILEILAKGEVKQLKVLVKADTQGSVEAIVDSLKLIESEKVSLKLIHHAVGTITETDVQFASASQAMIIGFHTRLDSGVSELAKHENVEIRLYAVIYELIDEVKLAMAGMLEPVSKETVVGTAEVRQVFELSKGGKVAGCIVNSGRIVRGKVRILRRKDLLYEGQIQSLRRFQDEVQEVRSGLECGIRVDGFHDFQTGDTLECFTVEKVAAKM
jgi:translation initiation factor IF-2